MELEERRDQSLDLYPPSSYIILRAEQIANQDSANTRQTTTTTSNAARVTSFSEVRSTFTSTASNGDVVLVTATSYVAVDPEPAATESSKSGGGGGGGLQNAAVPIGSVSYGLPVTFAAFIGGAMLLL